MSLSVTLIEIQIFLACCSELLIVILIAAFVPFTFIAILVINSSIS